MVYCAEDQSVCTGHQRCNIAGLSRLNLGGNAVGFLVQDTQQRHTVLLSVTRGCHAYILLCKSKSRTRATPGRPLTLDVNSSGLGSADLLE